MRDAKGIGGGASYETGLKCDGEDSGRITRGDDMRWSDESAETAVIGGEAGGGAGE